MRFVYPYVLIILLAVPLSWFISRRARLYFRPSQFYTFNLLRSLIWIAVVLALSGMQVAWGRFGSLNLFWVMDLSNSISPRQREWFKDYVLRASSSLPSRGKAGLIFCAKEASLALEPSGEDEVEEFFEKPLENLPDPLFTNLAAGVDSVVSMASFADANRIVLLSDGNENLGRLLKSAKSAGSRGIPIYPVIPPPGENKEVVVEELRLPGEVKKSEAFEVSVKVHNLNLEKVKAVLKLYVEGGEVAQKSLELVPGVNTHKWVQIIKEAGPVFYEAEAVAVEDTNKENNRAMGVVTVKSALPRVLCVEGKKGESRFLREVLSKNDIEVHVVDSGGLSSEFAALATYDGIIFNNVSRKAININQMNMLKSYVSDLGGGFMMLGGEESFSSGGYYNTPIEEILPVNMDQNVSYKFKQIMLIVLIDRSPSMEGTKLELAKKAAVRVMDQLRDSDMMGVFLFDSKHDPVFNFQMIWGKRQQMVNKINKITVGKGGTNIYPALEDAYKKLLSPGADNTKSPVQIKHILLLTDGKTYRGGDFEKLASKIAKSGMSISTIAVGHEAEVGLLTNIARSGRGLFHHPNDLRKLPELFVTDLEDAISKTPFVEKPFMPEVASPSPILKGIEAKELPPLKGYMVTKPKTGANMVLVSKVRGFEDPVLAHRRYGFGITIAYTSDVVPRWSTKWIGWDSFSKFWVQATRYMLRQENAEWVSVKVRRTPEGANITIDTGEKEAPRGELTAQAISPEGKEIYVPLERIGWGKYRGNLVTSSEGKFVLHLREKQGETTLKQHTRAIVVPPFLGEYRKFTFDEHLLRQVARISGGEYNPQTTKSILAPPGKTAQYVPLWQYLLALALVLFVVEVGLRKWWL